MGPQPTAAHQPADTPDITVESLDGQPSTSAGAVRQQHEETAVQEAAPSQPKPRRFLAQPTETTSRKVSAKTVKQDDEQSSRGGGVPAGGDPASLQQQSQPSVKSARRFLPQPVETSKTSHHSAGKSKTRRFKPELVESDYRSVKGDQISAKDREHVTLFPTKARVDSEPEQANRGARLTPVRSASLDLQESRFSYANLLRQQETRRHSFRIPDLPSIPSSGSDTSDSSPQTPSASASPTTTSMQPVQSRRAGPPKKNPHADEFSGYLLSLAAREVQEELKEQALAGFPNEQDYQPVDHFAINEEGRDSSGDQYLIYPQPHHIKSRRQSSEDLSWELEYMRHHKEEAEQRLRVMVSTKKKDHSLTRHHAASKKLGPSPPMLGGDIVLPQSESPEGTLSEDPSPESVAQGQKGPCDDCGGLWCAGPQSDNSRGTGLWMGTCHKEEGYSHEPHLMPGIMTPMIQNEGFNFTPPSPPEPQTLKVTRPVLSRKKTESEFTDSFVTQIYNYLSLGYPCVARYYDFELSKISGIPVEDLRQDDLITDARGYVVAPEDGQKADVACVRWKALRLYIHEWARQQPNMAEDETDFEAWGVRERRGSWAI
ncbi:hypothetical protein N7539_004457 [Penicillium diatomitis]|uniref:Uncharacterized protein n=1 Tax=Penicillium diatomitis TaxID=2819901 RepID=A0A9X0BYT1_9EURO|nr:uncharacterized protein N7539_004457 [Penicillium diatomitis]KAJ5489567.1 hypothetical protein N7539_004457 [Penicillium diatomitis]